MTMWLPLDPRPENGNEFQAEAEAQAGRNPRLAETPGEQPVDRPAKVERVQFPASPSPPHSSHVVKAQSE